MSAYLLLGRSPLPGLGAALCALALLLGLGGWAFHASADPGLRLRRDAFWGVSTGLLLGLIVHILRSA